MNTSVFVSTFLAASIEVIEMVAIIVAVQGLGSGLNTTFTSVSTALK